MADDTELTLVLTWVFTWVAEALMMLRLIMRKFRKQGIDLSDYFTIAAMSFLIVRLAMVHVVLIWGTNNLTATYRDSHAFTAQEIYRLEVGSKLTLAVRAVYNVYAWLQKGVVMLLYKRIFSAVPWMDTPLMIYWIILFATFVVAQVTTFSECHPFYLYWQVIPDPGPCTEALTQLLVLGIVTIITDVMLIFLPMPTVFRVKRAITQKLQLIGLFSIGFILVAMTIARLVENFTSGALQVNRTIWASIEALAAAFVANMPTLYTLRRQKSGSNDALESTAPVSQWTSKEASTRAIRSVELARKLHSPTFSGIRGSWDKQTTSNTGEHKLIVESAFTGSTYSAITASMLPLPTFPQNQAKGRCATDSFGL